MEGHGVVAMARLYIALDHCVLLALFGDLSGFVQQGVHCWYPHHQDPHRGVD